MFLNEKGKFMRFTCVLIGDLNWSLQTLLDLILFVDSLAWIQKWIGNFLSSSSPIRILWISFPLLLEPASAIAFEFAASGSELALELQGKTVQWWRFKIESLRTAMDFTVFAWIWFWKKLGFMNVLELFCDLVILICNWMERESEICLWLGAWMCMILTLCTIYSLPCVILTNEGVTCGLDLACVALDLNLKKGLKCKF